MGIPLPATVPPRVQSAYRAGADLRGRSRRGNGLEQAKIPVEVDEGRGVALEGRHADDDGFQAIIFALVQASAAAVADAIGQRGWRVRWYTLLHFSQVRRPLRRSTISGKGSS